MIRARITIALLAALPSARGQDAPAFTDPAPPTVVELGPAAPPEPVVPAGHRLHAAPRALHAEAIVEDWPCFLGSRRDGRSRETRLALEWTADGPPLVWELERGEGFAAPVVAGNVLVHTHRIGDEVHVDAHDATTGMRRWRSTTASHYEPRYIKNAGPRSTPVIDGGRVLVHDVEGRLRCLELETGRLIWQRNISAEFDVPSGFFGVVSSPLVHAGLCIQLVGGTKGPSVAAFRVADGTLAWGAGRVWLSDCASPVVAVVRERARVFALTGGETRPPSGGLMVLDALSGAIELELPFRSRTFESVNAACPLVVGERVFVTASYNTGSAAVELDADGAWKELWRERHTGIQFANPIALDGKVYVVDGVSHRAGALVCIDPASGEVLARTDLTWDEELELDGTTQTRPASVGEGSLLWADGRFVCLGDGGQLVSIEADPEGATIHARASLFRAHESWTPPVLSHGLLYICQNQAERAGGAPMRLLCYDLRGE